MLEIFAGPSAYLHIQNHGLEPNHIHSVFGASGAAKWLTIAGLDHAIFSRWLNQSSHIVHLFGTSVGAWKLAAAAQANPAEAIAELSNAYIDQHYGENIKHSDIIRETERIITRCLHPQAVTEILSNPRYRLHFGAVRCHGLMAKDSKAALSLALAKATLMNRRGRHGLQKTFERVIFSDPRNKAPLRVRDGYRTEIHSLTYDNFHRALTAAGSIPYVMPGVTDIPNVPPGMYRDGGLLDYHPVPELFWQSQNITLYPHFYGHLIPGWFDKFIKRSATAAQLDKVVLISPSAKFVAALPNQKIPDRQDFKKYFRQDEQRQTLWKTALQKSYELGEAFIELALNGNIAKHVKPIANVNS